MAQTYIVSIECANEEDARIFFYLAQRINCRATLSAPMTATTRKFYPEKYREPAATTARVERRVADLPSPPYYAPPAPPDDTPAAPPDTPPAAPPAAPPDTPAADSGALSPAEARAIEGVPSPDTPTSTYPSNE